LSTTTDQGDDTFLPGVSAQHDDDDDTFSYSSNLFIVIFPPSGRMKTADWDGEATGTKLYFRTIDGRDAAAVNIESNG